MPGAAHPTDVDPVVDANPSYDPRLFAMAKDEAVIAIVKVWVRSRRRNRNADLLTTIMINLVVQMKQQRPDWFASLGQDGQQRLITETISEAKKQLYDWVEPKSV
jgi:hypothetical protein